MDVWFITVVWIVIGVIYVLLVAFVSGCLPHVPVGVPEVRAVDGPVGWHYLSDSTCLIWPRRFSTALLV